MSDSDPHMVVALLHTVPHVGYRLSPDPAEGGAPDVVADIAADVAPDIAPDVAADVAPDIAPDVAADVVVNGTSPSPANPASASTDKDVG